MCVFDLAVSFFNAKINHKIQKNKDVINAED